MLFDGTSPRTRTIALSKAPKSLDAVVTLDGDEVDAFPIDPSTAFPAKERAGLGPLLPYRPERRTYPLFDSTSGEDVGMDYLGPGSVQGLDTYKYSAALSDGCVRTVDAERRTGRILDEVWDCGADQWVLADETKAAQVSAAGREVAWLRGLQVMSVITRIIAAAAFVAGLVLYARRR